MPQATASDAAQRLERLCGYLAQDPGNAQLREDAFDAALRAGRPDRAAELAQGARRGDSDHPGWGLRQAQALIAAGRLEAAESVLDELAGGEVVPDAIEHDRALVRLLQGDAAGCLQRLRERLLARQAGAPLQVLWLRAHHRSGALEEAWSWTSEQQRSGRLTPAAAGVAALIAVDLDRLPEAERLADLALQEEGGPLEALVARASVLLARRDPAAARALLQQAVDRDDREGRAWSTLAFASLLCRDFAAAREQFRRATEAMPGHIGTWHGRGWCELLLQDLPAALQSFRQALRLDETFAESQAAVGLLLALSGDHAAASAHLLRAERLEPAGLTVRYARALQAGEAGTQAQILRLAKALLDRPGPLGERMSGWLEAAVEADARLSRAGRPRPGSTG
jgi:tetratricopeptide (TPR) repeat protein